MDSNQYAIELVTYLLVLVVHFYELIVYMLLERNSFDSIAFFSQCTVYEFIHHVQEIYPFLSLGLSFDSNSIYLFKVRIQGEAESPPPIRWIFQLTFTFCLFY